MTIWELDFYRRPLQDADGNPLWELVICDRSPANPFIAYCPQSQVSADWLQNQLHQRAAETAGLPTEIWVFRPQSLNLLETAAQSLDIRIIPTRRTPSLKSVLQAQARRYPTQPGYTGQSDQLVQVEKLPPVPIPEEFQGMELGFTHLPAAELVEAFSDRPIPVLDLPADLLPLHLGLASSVAIAGVVLTPGKQSRRLATWLQEIRPVSLHYRAGDPDGLILEAGLCDRWIITTVADPQATQAGHRFEQLKHLAKGLHFLLVQPDHSGMTYSGFWLLQPVSDPGD